MKFQFKIQQYQTDAVDNTVSVFAGQPPHCNRKTGTMTGKEMNAYR